MKNHTLLLILGLLALFSREIVFAQVPTVLSEKDPALPAFVSEHKTAKPGESFWIGLDFKIQPGWHVYWRNPGDSGLPAKVEWSLPSGVEVSDFEWPTPHKFSSPPLASYGYENHVLLPMKLTIKPEFTGQKLTLKGKVRWLVCREQCLMRKGDLVLNLNISKNTVVDPVQQAAFKKTLHAMPIANPDLKFVATKSTKQIELKFSHKSDQKNEKVFFLPYHEGMIDDSAEQKILQKSEEFRLTILRDEGSSKKFTTLEGLLVIGDQGYLVSTKLN